MSVLGPSGCGKTTLLNIVAGFLAPTEGQITLNGHKVTGPDAERGMVFQQGALFEWMSVRDNVAFGPRMKGMPEGRMGGDVDHLLDVVGLQDFKEKAVYELSGGMQQRVALARCLANDPDVILMDEPLGRARRADARKDAGPCAQALEGDRQDHHPDHPLGRRGAAAGRAASW
jgi:taurine transport system ATP-binding protein